MSACRTCIHFISGCYNPSSAEPRQDMFTAVGLCRAHPPVWASGDNEDGAFVFPVVHRDHRCGEWTDTGPWEDTLPC
jgi:hypothetical protein